MRLRDIVRGSVRVWAESLVTTTWLSVPLKK